MLPYDTVGLLQETAPAQPATPPKEPTSLEDIFADDDMDLLADWIQHVDRILLAPGEDLLTHAGTISREQMTEKVEQEYRRYQAKTLSQVEKDYLAHIKHLEKTAQGGEEK